MENFEIATVLPVLIGAFILLVVFLIVVNRIFVNVGAREIAIKERRYLGAKMPPGRVVATEGEVGIQADVLKPGLHLIKFPFEKVVRKVPLIEIGADEMGIIEAVDGEPMPPGRIFAPDRAQNAHNNFQDPIAFIKRGGVKGIQLRTLPPGLVAHPSVPVSRFNCESDPRASGQSRRNYGRRRRSTRSGPPAWQSDLGPSPISGCRTVHRLRRTKRTAGRHPDAGCLSHPDAIRIYLKDRTKPSRVSSMCDCSMQL